MLNTSMLTAHSITASNQQFQWRLTCGSATPICMFMGGTSAYINWGGGGSGTVGIGTDTACRWLRGIRPLSSIGAYTNTLISQICHKKPTLKQLLNIDFYSSLSSKNYC